MEASSENDQSPISSSGIQMTFSDDISKYQSADEIQNSKSGRGKKSQKVKNPKSELKVGRPPKKSKPVIENKNEINSDLPTAIYMNSRNSKIPLHDSSENILTKNCFWIQMDSYQILKFRKSLENIKDFWPKIWLEVTSEGLSIFNQAETNPTVYFRFEWRPSFFDYFLLNPDESYIISLSVPLFIKKLSNLDRSQKVIFKISKKEVLNDSQNFQSSSKRNIRIPLMTIKAKDQSSEDSNESFAKQMTIQYSYVKDESIYSTLPSTNDIESRLPCFIYVSGIEMKEAISFFVKNGYHSIFLFTDFNYLYIFGKEGKEASIASDRYRLACLDQETNQPTTEPTKKLPWKDFQTKNILQILADLNGIDNMKDNRYLWQGSDYVVEILSTFSKSIQKEQRVGLYFGCNYEHKQPYPIRMKTEIFQNQQEKTAPETTSNFIFHSVLSMVE
jgi:hypothetical protein